MILACFWHSKILLSTMKHASAQKLVGVPNSGGFGRLQEPLRQRCPNLWPIGDESNCPMDWSAGSPLPPPGSTWFHRAAWMLYRDAEVSDDIDQVGLNPGPIPAPGPRDGSTLSKLPSGKKKSCLTLLPTLEKGGLWLIKWIVRGPHWRWAKYRNQNFY